MLRRAVLIVALMAVALLGVARADGAEALTADNFDDRTANGVWLIKFYAPWCGHCKSLAPTFDKLPSDAAIQGTDVHIAKVDCTVHKSICMRFEVKSYPTIKAVANKLSFDYVGQRDSQHLIDFVTGGYKKVPGEEVLSQPQFEARQIQMEKEMAEAEKNSLVETLTTTSFDELVHDKSEPWLLKFYAPWCGHCKRLAPVWDKLSASLKDSGSSVKVGKVDCTKYRRVCSRFSVNGYPSLFFVKEGQVYKYEGARTLEGFTDYIKSGYTKAENIGGIPDESMAGALVDGLLEWASEHTLWAVLAGIVALAIIVAILVALLDYCMGDEEYPVSHKDRLAHAEALLKERQGEDSGSSDDDDEPADKEKLVDGVNKAN
ncbi:thioredoxin-like protein [Achlya hypogyna]|uniref:Thioredoxin-like protein n=1 Tax=Achlya hypogyna TaxID=1202772 RepID=A0A1V9YCY1_ACHHY|nr:thioredoxin-like protein [Achlya hypogyna]